jgi:hypothetical protein
MRSSEEIGAEVHELDQAGERGERGERPPQHPTGPADWAESWPTAHPTIPLRVE